jgi:predicted glycogen debranching enzyme
MQVSVEQCPRPGTEKIYREGDFITIELKLSAEVKGKAWLRSNLFHPDKKRDEIIERTEQNIPRRYQEWGDFPMFQQTPDTFKIELPLSSVGFFEAKAYFIPEGTNELVWPGGENLGIKVEPADTIAGNSLYCAFVRLFMDEEKLVGIKENVKDQTQQGKNINILPETGKFRTLIPKLDFIIEKLGFDIIMLLPVHPVPTTYARMGLLGSPYASLDFFSVDPALAEFDKETTPLHQFEELIDAVHAKNAKIFIDIPINHTGWASQLQVHHPEYFIKDEEGKFISPGAWGVTWSDLSELDYSKKGLWEYMAEVFLFWCKKGIDGFRCDAGYMVPANAWKYITSKVRKEYPDTIFLLEGLGGKIKTTEKLLTDSNLNWAYSEMFQNYNQEEMEWYLEQFKDTSFNKGPLVNFSETHDNNRLASVSKEFSRLRNGLTALLSDTGTFAITCGVEWFADEKIDVHKLTSLKWGNSDNQVQFIKRLNNILKLHPCFKSGSRLIKMHTSSCNSIAYLREHKNGNEKLAVIANLSEKNNSVFVNKELAKAFLNTQTDLLSGNEINFNDNSNDYEIKLSAYQIIVLSNNESYLEALSYQKAKTATIQLKTERLLKKQLIQLFEAYNYQPSEQFLLEKMQEFQQDPYQFFFSSFESRPPVIKWTYPQDTKREVVIPRNTPLLITCPWPFRFRLEHQDKTKLMGSSYNLKNKHHVSIISPYPFKKEGFEFSLHLEVFEGSNILKKSGHLMIASYEELFINKNKFYEQDIHSDRLLASLAVNRKSGISVLRGAFSELKSKYDGLISANLHPDVPEERNLMLTRFRAWSVFKGFSRSISEEYQHSFEHYLNTTEYYFEMPVGGGLHTPLTFNFKFDESDNILVCQVKRLNKTGISAPPPEEPVKIIIRPDIESRNQHELTKAYTGPENRWPQHTEHNKHGFLFSDIDKVLSVEVQPGSFTREDEWQYMISRPVEKERGMDGDGDIFSPGYFTIMLKANEEASIYAAAGQKKDIESLKNKALQIQSDILYIPEIQNIERVLQRSIQKFIVERNNNKTIIAGYPWFMDWGRDTLICLRGVIAAGYLEEAESIIKEFASFEQNGTLPNIIRGGDTSNRDTSDAPLWLFAAVDDLMKQNTNLAKLDCNGRTLKEILRSIVENYMKGTTNGIQMDPDSGLIYSPTHYTWMDTNHPAGTPREGYPVEIQALWYHALSVLSFLYPKEVQWEDLQQQVQYSLITYFLRKSGKQGFLSDCLHTKGFQPVKEAIPDDHLRPNQLFAVTFNALNEPDICSGIISACEELIAPGAIRTLADRDTAYNLPVYHQGKLINKPSHPYIGVYTGEEDTSRKPAYHNGTAWTWPFPTYCEALFKVYGNAALVSAGDILSSAMKYFNSGCINQLPEILDGNYPHLQKGCYAQAWSVTELYRVARMLKMFPE